MAWWQVVLLLGGGFAAGAINSLAGGGSMLSVPLLVMAGVPGTMANGSNRLGILAASASAAVEFRRRGVDGVRSAGNVLAAVVVGSVVGAYAITLVDDTLFERIFGFLMVPLLVLSLRRRPPAPTADDGTEIAPTPWPTWLTWVVFVAIGAYGGAFQAGIGLVLMVALLRSGLDVVTANAVKVVVTLVVTVVALPVFIAQGQIAWAEGLVLALGFAVGGRVGAALTVSRGDEIVRPVLIVAVLVSSTRLLGLWG